MCNAPIRLREMRSVRTASFAHKNIFNIMKKYQVRQSLLTNNDLYLEILVLIFIFWTR